MTKVVVAFHNFANAPKNVTINVLVYEIYLRSYVSNSQSNLCMPQQILFFWKMYKLQGTKFEYNI
jgi:hypothetical protein